MDKKGIQNEALNRIEKNGGVYGMFILNELLRRRFIDKNITAYMDELIKKNILYIDKHWQYRLHADI